MAAKALAQASEPGNDPVSYVYVIGPDGGPYKIGVANDVDTRRGQIQVNQPLPIAVLYRHQVPAPRRYDVEKYAHAMLATRRTHGEWFKVDREAAIRAVQTAANDVEVGRLAPAKAMIDKAGDGSKRRISRDGLATLIRGGALTPRQASAARLYRRLFDTAADDASDMRVGGTVTRPPSRVAMSVLSKVDGAVRAQVAPRAATALVEIIGKGQTLSRLPGSTVQRHKQRNELVAALDVVASLLTPEGQVE